MKTPIWFKVLMLMFGLISWAILESTRIPFIYIDQMLNIVVLAYLVLTLATCLSCWIRMNSKPIKSKLNRPVDTINTKSMLLACLGIWLFPLVIGWLLLQTSPLIADLFATEIKDNEYKMVSTEEYGRTNFYLTKVQVIDEYNNSDDFLIGNGMLNQLNLHEGDKLVVTGRNCIAGVVIDKINGIERK